MPAPFTTPVALSTPFEPNRNPGYGGVPSGLESENVQDAIEEAKQDALNNDRFLVLPNYGGNAITGRYLEFYPGQSSLDSPLFFAAPGVIRSVTLQTTAANATCEVGIFNANVSLTIPIYTVVITAQKRVEYVGMPTLGVIPANSLIVVRVTSGSILRPTMQLTFSASTS